MSKAASKLSCDERILAVSEILAAGLVRLSSRQSSGLPPPPEDSYLDLPRHQSGHAKPKCTGEAGA